MSAPAPAAEGVQVGMGIPVGFSTFTTGDEATGVKPVATQASRTLFWTSFQDNSPYPPTPHV